MLISEPEIGMVVKSPRFVEAHYDVRVAPNCKDIIKLGIWVGLKRKTKVLLRVDDNFKRFDKIVETDATDPTRLGAEFIITGVVLFYDEKSSWRCDVRRLLDDGCYNPKGQLPPPEGGGLS